MLNFVRPFVAASLILAFASCGDSTGPKTASEAQSLWQSKNISNYSYVAETGCFCSTVGPVKVEVVGGHVTRVTLVATRAALPTTGRSTIEELFDQIRSTSPPLTVTFDRVLGYPTRIEYCCLADDSGAVITISSLIPSS
jgi:hypothetical protein